MQPDQQKNYWEKDLENPKPEDAVEMYAPAQSINEDKINDTQNDSQPIDIDEETVHWSAVEYIEREKGSMWFVLFWVVVVLLIASDILFLKSYTFSALIAVMAIAIIILSRRPAQEIKYTLSGQQGLYVGEKLYHFSEFKSFGLINDEGNYSIMLVPIKRFSLGVSIYFPYDVGEKIVDILGARLPMQEMELDLVDKFVRQLRL